MLSTFMLDLQGAKAAERITLEAFQRHSPQFKFIDISANPDYYYKGDLLAVGANGKRYYIEVKDDSRIADTHNVLCEYGVFMNDSGAMRKGNMYSSCDLYCVVSKQEHLIYVLDFQKLQAIYKEGKHKTIQHKEQTTYAYLCSLEMLDAVGAVLGTLEF